MNGSETERAARAAWRYGAQWIMYTRCSGCGEVKVCAGRTRRNMRCLECFDLGVKK
jgi:ribosomal protein S27E